MANVKAPILIAAAAAGIYFLMRSAKNFGATMRATVQKVSFNLKETQRAAFLRAFFNVNLEITNPSNFSAQIQAIKLDVLMNKRVLGNINQTLKIEIPKEGKTILPVLVGINTLSLYGNINTAIKNLGAGTPLQFTVVGTVLTNYGTINVSEFVTVG